MACPYDLPGASGRPSGTCVQGEPGRYVMCWVTALPLDAEFPLTGGPHSLTLSAEEKRKMNEL